MDPIDDEDELKQNGNDQLNAVATMPLPAAKPTSPAVPPPMAQKPQAPMPGMPPSVDQNELGDFLAGQKQGIEKYGPEKQLDTEQALIKARTSPGASLASAGAGLADAIMQGVAGAGNPGFQKNLQEQGNQISQEAGGAMEKARTGKLEELKAEKELGQEDPGSPLSRIAQKAYGPQLISMGATPAQVAQIPASLIASIQTGSITLTEALARIHEQGAYQQGMLENSRQGRKEAALKARADMGYWGGIGQPEVAKGLEEAGGIGGGGAASGPTVNSQEAHANLAPGTLYTVNGKTYRKK